MPPVAEGSITNETLAAGVIIGEAGTSMDFIANATSAIFAQGWTPELQKWSAADRRCRSPKAVQAEYERQLSE